MSDARGLAIAKLSGAIQYLTTGSGQDLPYFEKIAQLHKITLDPQVLGHVLGHIIVNAEQDGRLLDGDATRSKFAWCVPLLRAAGADEAEASAAEYRERISRFRSGHQT